MPGTPFADKDVMIIAYGNGCFVAFCCYFQGYDPMLTYSDDGINWTTVSNSIIEAFGFYNIVYANGVFIGGYHSARMIYSFDGITWYPDEKGFIISALEGDGDNLGGIAYGNGRFVISAGNGIAGSSKIVWSEMPPVPIKNFSDFLAETDITDYITSIQIIINDVNSYKIAFDENTASQNNNSITIFLEGRTKEELSIFRNYLFAMKGYKFQTQTWIDLFEKHISGYVGQYSNSEVMEMFTDDEKWLLELIIKYENTN